jgi:hypothetical protein
LAAAAVIVSAIALPGCGAAAGPRNGDARQAHTQPSAPANTSWTHELTRDEVWYVFPAQAQPPNGTIAKGTKVRVITPAGSYTEVLTDGGIRGYVLTDSLRKL